VANLGVYENELDKAADLTLILTSCRLLELLFESSESSVMETFVLSVPVGLSLHE
jgi:hypothetical protein